MNEEYANCSNKNFLTWSFVCRLMTCLIILFIASGCAGNKSAIINATSSGDINTVKRLQAEGQSINEADTNGVTPLMHAISSKNQDLVKHLIQSGADIKAKDKNGCDALISAVDYNQIDLINILIDKGADIESRDFAGDTPLSHAAYSVQPELIRILLDKGANIESRNNIGHTPLVQAALLVTDIDSVKLLIKRGADANIKDNASRSLVSLLLDNPGTQTMGIIDELINAGVKLFEPTKGKARLWLIAEAFVPRVTATVTLGKSSFYLSKSNAINFIDVDPGNITIDICESRPAKHAKFSTDVKSGQTYFFKILQSGKASTAKALVGLPGMLIMDPFEISLMEESVGKARIKELLKPSN